MLDEKLEDIFYWIKFCKIY